MSTTSVAKALSISVPNPMVASTKISVKNHAAIELAESIEKAENFAEGMLKKASDPNAKFANTKTVCKSCFGSNFRLTYQNGKRFARKCEAAKWDEEKKRLVCEGNSNWQELELANKRDLANEIWKVVMHLKQKEFFLFWMQKEYKTQKLSELMLQQLETVLRKVQARNIFLVKETPSQSQENSQIQAA